MPAENSKSQVESSKHRHTVRWMAVGLVAGVLCGLLFGEYCGVLKSVGRAYVGLLQMTVLPYLMLSLIAKTGRLDARVAKRLGLTALGVLLVLWLIGIVLVVIVSTFLPAVEGATFFSSAPDVVDAGEQDVLSKFIPTNVFRSLSDEVVPAVVVFCLFFGAALIPIPGKEPLLDFLDLCVTGIGRINMFLIRLAPIGLFAMTAAAAGTLRIEELARLQAYLILYTLACGLAAFGILPLLLASVTRFRYRELLGASQEPLLTAFATGKLFVVLPQIVDKCEQLLRNRDGTTSTEDESTISVMVPLAYPFPHIGKILAFVFVSFAAWYVGRGLTLSQTGTMASAGAVSSFASPLIAIPYLLDKYQLPQDLMPFFILPGFITTRLADLVGVLHLMALSLIVNEVANGRFLIRWRRLATAVCTTVVCLVALGVGTRWYLSSTTLDYQLDDRLLSLEIATKHEDVVVYRTRDEVPDRDVAGSSTLDRIKADPVLRVGYHPDHLPYSFFNRQQQLVGLDVELVYRLAVRLNVRLEFVPFTKETVFDQLATGEIDLAIGGLILTPERMLEAGFTQPYDTATASVVLRDHRRGELETWNDPDRPDDLRLGVVTEEVAAAARRRLPNVEMVVIDSLRVFFTDRRGDLDGVLVAAEEGAAWNVLYPEYSVVVPKPVLRRPVGMAVRLGDTQWLGFLDRWLDFERLEGSLDHLRRFWVEGGGTEDRQPRWCVLRNVLQWVP